MHSKKLAFTFIFILINSLPLSSMEHTGRTDISHRKQESSLFCNIIPQSISLVSDDLNFEFIAWSKNGNRLAILVNGDDSQENGIEKSFSVEVHDVSINTDGIILNADNNQEDEEKFSSIINIYQRICSDHHPDLEDSLCICSFLEEFGSLVTDERKSEGFVDNCQQKERFDLLNWGIEDNDDRIKNSLRDKLIKKCFTCAQSKKLLPRKVICSSKGRYCVVVCVSQEEAPYRVKTLFFDMAVSGGCEEPKKIIEMYEFSDQGDLRNNVLNKPDLFGFTSDDRFFYPCFYSESSPDGPQKEARAEIHVYDVASDCVLTKIPLNMFCKNFSDNLEKTYVHCVKSSNDNVSLSIRIPRCIKWFSDNRFLAIAFNSQIELWYAPGRGNGLVTRISLGDEFSLGKVRWHPRYPILAVQGGPEVRLYDLRPIIHPLMYKPEELLRREIRGRFQK